MFALLFVNREIKFCEKFQNFSTAKFKLYFNYVTEKYLKVSEIDNFFSLYRES